MFKRIATLTICVVLAVVVPVAAEAKRDANLRKDGGHQGSATAVKPAQTDSRRGGRDRYRGVDRHRSRQDRPRQAESKPETPKPETKRATPKRSGGGGSGARRERASARRDPEPAPVPASPPVVAATTPAPPPAPTPPAVSPATSPATATPDAEPGTGSPGAGRGAPADLTTSADGSPAGGVLAASGAFGGAPGDGAFAGAAPVGTAATTPAGGGGNDDSARARRDAPETVTRTVVRRVRQAAEVIPGYVWALIAGLGALLLAAAGLSSLLAGRARRLSRQRAALLADVGLLQEALLPADPEQVAGAAATAAYRPATARPPGGDFYDVFALDSGRLGLIVGRVSASGRRALGITAFIRHVLRAYLEGGLQPRNALQVGAEVLEHHLGPDYATVTLALYDRATSELTYAGAGTPAPVVLGAAAFEPVTACAAAPIGMGVHTGTRQTSVVLPEAATAAFFTDGLVDARVDGDRYGYRRAWRALEELDGDAGADVLLGRVADEADASGGDMAAVLLRVGDGAPGAAPGGQRRVEELELSGRELDGERPGLFLRDCGVPTAAIGPTVEEARERGRRLGGVVLRVRYGPGVPEAEADLRTMDVLHVPSAAERRQAGAEVSAARPSDG
jgi:serine phosphatase RsbU (regulator of sigma subunit)